MAHLLSTQAVWAQGYRKGSPALLNRHQPEDGWVGRVPGEGPCTDRAGETSEDTTLASQSQDGLLLLSCFPLEEEVATHSSILAWEIPWTEVRDIVQKTGIKTILVEKKCKKAKGLSEEALQIAVKSKGKKGKICV